MDQVVAVVCQNPVGVFKPLHADRVFASFFQLESNLFANGLDLPGIRSGADYEKIGKGCDLPEV